MRPLARTGETALAGLQTDCLAQNAPPTRVDVLPVVPVVRHGFGELIQKVGARHRRRNEPKGTSPS